MPDIEGSESVVLDTTLLQSLSHPLRMRLVGLLRVHGPSTATKLAERCGESSGLTSYHLRQLAASGLIEEAGPEDIAGVVRTGGRERWWRAAHPSSVADLPDPGDEAGLAANADYLRAVVTTYSRNAHSWLSASHTWPQRWRGASNFSDQVLRLSYDELVQLNDELWEVVTRYRRHDSEDRNGGSDAPEDTVIVSAQFQIFPYPDQEIPEESPQLGDADTDLGE